MQHVVSALPAPGKNKLHIHCTNTDKFSLESVLIKWNLCGTKCRCSHTVIETNGVLFIKIHNFIRKILLLLECKSLPPPTLKSFCTGVTGTIAAGSTHGQASAWTPLRSHPTKKIPGTPKRHHSRNGTAPERCASMRVEKS